MNDNQPNQTICPNCGFHNDPGAQFCNLCRLALPTAAPDEFDSGATSVLPAAETQQVAPPTGYGQNYDPAATSILPPDAGGNLPDQRVLDANAPTQMFQPQAAPRLQPTPTPPPRPSAPPPSRYDPPPSQTLVPVPPPRRFPILPVALTGLLLLAGGLALALILQPRAQNPVVGPTPTSVAQATQPSAAETATAISIALLSPTVLEGLPTITPGPSSTPVELPSDTPEPSATPEPSDTPKPTDTALPLPPTATAELPTPQPTSTEEKIEPTPIFIRPTREPGVEPPPPLPAPPPSGNDVPASINGTISPNEGPLGTRFALRGTGFEAGEGLRYWLTNPQGQVVPDVPLSLNAVLNPGGQLRYAFATDDLPINFTPGIWAMTIEGLESGNQAIFYFRIKQ